MVFAALTGLSGVAQADPHGDAKLTGRDLVVAAGSARYLLSASADQLAGTLEPGSRAVVMTALRPGGRADRDPLWSLLATGAAQFRRETAEGGETLWFNPLFDAGLALRWRLSPGGWTVVAAAPVLGETVRGEPEPQGPFAPTPTWLLRTRSIGAGLQRAEEGALPRLAAGTWSSALDAPEALRAARGGIAVKRVARGLIALRGMSMDARYRTALRTLRVSLAAETGTIAQPVSAGLAAIGPDARRTLRPVAAFRRHDGWTVAMESPDAPTVTLLAHYLDPPSTDASPVPPAHLDRWDVVRFGALPSPALSVGSIRP